MIVNLQHFHTLCNKIIIVVFWESNHSSPTWLSIFPHLLVKPVVDAVRKLSWKLLETGNLEIVSNLFLVKKSVCCSLILGAGGS